MGEAGLVPARRKVRSIRPRLGTPPKPPAKSSLAVHGFATIIFSECWSALAPDRDARIVQVLVQTGVDITPVVAEWYAEFAQAPLPSDAPEYRKVLTQTGLGVGTARAE